MALQFSETAPGVHTSSILNPKTEKRHNIAIIESCDAWQLFVDGELAVRDLPSFKAAVAEAEAKLAAPRTSTMVRAACILVVLGVAGATTIGMTKVLTPLLSTQTAVAADATDVTDAKDGTVEHRFTRVRPSAAPRISRDPVVAATRSPVVEENVVEVSVAPTAVPSAEQRPAQPVASQTNTVETTPADQEPVQNVATAPDAAPAPAAGEVAALGLKPIVAPAPTAQSLYAPSTRTNKTPSSALPPVVINARPKGGTPVEAAPENETRGVAAALPPAQSEDLDAADQDVAQATPPLPGKAPVVAAPLIRPARAPINPERMTSILAELEVEANEPVTRATGQAKVKRHTTKRRTSKRRSTSPRRRVRHAATKRSHRNAHRPRHVHRVAPARRMVCFAHTCRFR